MRTPRLPVVDWTDAPADLNGLVRVAGRTNLVSARVPSYSVFTLHKDIYCCSGNNLKAECRVWTYPSPIPVLAVFCPQWRCTQQGKGNRMGQRFGTVWRCHGFCQTHTAARLRSAWNALQRWFGSISTSHVFSLFCYWLLILCVLNCAKLLERG